ncbi:MAG: hypothetical protein WD073_05485 [Xanthobacteraceae bacterium]
MTAKTWPEAILGRGVLRDGFSYKRQPAIETSPMDSGLARGRLFNSNPLARVPCQFVFDEFQCQFFEAWLQTVAARGAAWFYIYLPLEGVTYRKVLARVVGEPPRLPRGALTMAAQIEFEVHDALVLPDGIVDVVLELGAAGAQQIVAALDTPMLQPYFDAYAPDFGA